MNQTKVVTARTFIETDRTHLAVMFLGTTKALKLARKYENFYDTRDPLMSGIYHESVRIIKAIDLDLEAVFNKILED